MAGPLAAPAPAGPDPGGGGPEALLAQIRMLLEQYLAMGDQTPVAPEAQQLADAIDQAAPGAAGPEMAAPGDVPDMGGGAAPAGPGAPPPTDLGALDNMLPQAGEPPRTTGRSSFKAANKNAADRLKKRNAKQ